MKKYSRQTFLCQRNATRIGPLKLFNRVLWWSWSAFFRTIHPGS